MIKLDTVQMEIVREPSKSRQLIMAGPGRGKTELVAQKILYLIDEGDLQPSELLVLSFSRSAVRTLSNRLHLLSPTSPGLVESLRHISIRTFDSWSHRILRFLGHTVIECLKRSYDANIEILCQILSDDGSNMVHEKHPCGLYRIKHIIVDEVQDLSGIRTVLVLRLLDLICSKSRLDNGFTLLGDENQAIYDFAYRENRKGMTALQFLEEIRQRWKKSLIQRELTHNYRCAPPVDAIITKVSNILKSLREKSLDPLPALKTLLDEIRPADINKVLENTGTKTAILCRNNGQALFQASDLILDLHNDVARRIKVHAGSVPVRLPYWIGTLLSLYSGQAPLTINTVQKIYDTLCNRGIQFPYNAGQLWNMLCNVMQFPENSTISMNELITRLQWPDSLPDDDYEDENSLVLLTTVHQSKGQEFDNVLILRDGLAENIHNCDVVEEGRIAYVAVSRARSNLSCIIDHSDMKLKKRTFGRDKRERWFGLKVFQDGKRQRYVNYLEIGILGDVEETSFADTAFHGGETEVKKLQSYIATKAESLAGEKVLLKKRTIEDRGERKVCYDIYLDADHVLLGTCSNQLSKDLLSLRNHKKLRLPREIDGLRIAQVFSYICNSTDLARLPEPFSKSGIWLSVSIHGIGHYEYYFS